MRSVMKYLCLCALLFLLPVVALRAELPPSAYEAMQKEAPEYLQIEVLRVEIEPGAEPAQQKITLVALVHEVGRSANGLKANDIINIVYTVTDRKGMVGPGQVPILAEKDQTVAFLTQIDDGDYGPAAGRMSFSKF